MSDNQTQCCGYSPTTRGWTGEFIGTFLMCFFGIGAVATATLYSAHTGPFQVGIIWGIAIAIAIYATRNLSCAHFNPAVTLAMCISKRSSWRIFPVYLTAQLLGAIVASIVLWIFFKDSSLAAMAAENIDFSVASAPSSIWCEVFPNTTKGVISTPVAAFAEGFGVFILVIIIFSMTEGCNLGRPSDDIFPLFIGLTISCLIATIGPMTNAGLNPARDIGPRIVGFFAGWKDVAFSSDAMIVYVLAPFIGGALAALIFTKIIEPIQSSTSNTNCC
ncbi:Glycerol uptake facilitator protein [Aedoeadaptatus nemausensis]|uniref:Glycerol uptake facilitator protein n=1 Tax=Aedoeadaptatus nemausensis TaxID=2582829 RepID=A0A6V6XYJ2_9FIRM|nr:MIP/aquaporin family protein [Peptoniphilus nemausensis]CAC9922221.1 Glycerol uptake facilitator protein [Peptoniphilus nemausensis]